MHPPYYRVRDWCNNYLGVNFFFSKNVIIIAVNQGLVTIVIKLEFAYKAILFLRAAKKVKNP